MNEFQRAKKTGMLRRGHDFEVIYRYWGKKYATYAPICCVAGICTFSFAHVVYKSDLNTWINSFITNIWEFIGLDGLGMYNNTKLKLWSYFFTDATSIEPNAAMSFTGLTWYMTAIICFGAIFFTLLVMNEKVTMFIVAPIMISTTFLTFDLDEMIGFKAILPENFLKLWGPAMLGLIGWYVVEALKQKDWSDKAKNVVGWIHLGMFIATFAMIYVGYPGGMLHFDVWISILLCISLVGKDWFSEKFNELFEKLPFITKYMRDFGLGLFALQTIFRQVAQFMYEAGILHSKVESYWAGVALSCAGGVVWAIVLAPIVKWLTKLLIRILGLNKPFGTMSVIADLEVK